MALAPGTRVGSYEILGPLGAGGMGDVYRARDTTLHREVAIKVLPDRFVGDLERIARLKREAQLLAALNHPHIAAIHGLEEWTPPGLPDAQRSHLLILELVDGESLATRLSAGPLRIDQVIDLAKQIADALEEAHDKGIVHRDLKPGNIMLTVDDRVKVLDFGLARSADEPGATDDDDSPTATVVAATRAGVILGTAAYMAPEQVKGRVVDKRADIWAFGCVLYEMITGVRAFEREGVSETLAAILRDEPDLNVLPASTPPSVRALVQRCLQKGRQARIHDMAVARYMLDEAPGDSSLRVAASAPARARLSWVVAATAGGIVAGGLLMWALVPADAPRPAVTTRFTIESDNLAGIPPSVGATHRIAVSEDGRHVAYVGRTVPNAPLQVMVRSLDQLDAVSVAGTVGAQNIMLSPDGAWIAYWSADGVWRKVARGGGTPIDLWRGGGQPLGGTWMADGSLILAAHAPKGLVRIPADGGEPAILTTPSDGERTHAHPSALPDSGALLFTVNREQTTGSVSQDVVVLNIATGAYRTLITGASQAAYADTGHLIYTTGTVLRAVRFDAARAEVIGDPVAVLDGASPQYFSMARNGTLAYRMDVPRTEAQREFVWVDRQGNEDPVPAPIRPFFLPHLSSDDGRLAFLTRGDGQDISVWDFERRTMTRLMTTPRSDLNPVWTSGDRELLFSSIVDGAFNLFRMRADGAGDVEPVTSSQDSLFSTSITPDARHALVVVAPVDGGVVFLGLVDLRSGGVQPLLRSEYRVNNGELSSDGRWLAYQSDENGRDEVYVRPFPDVQSSRIQISTDGGIMPVWSRDVRELFYVDPGGNLMAVAVDTEPAFKAVTPTRILEGGKYFFSEDAQTYDVSRDGRRFLMMKDRTPGTAKMVVITNWGEELKRLLPAVGQ